MAAPNPVSTTAPANPSDGIRSFLKLIESARQSTSTGQVQGTGQVLAELAYKLTQVAGQCSDPILLKDSICSLLDALDGLRRSISDRR
jgi:hypothetical protein